MGLRTVLPMGLRTVLPMGLRTVSPMGLRTVSPMGLRTFLTRFGQILVKKLLNVFKMSVLFFTTFSLFINDLGKVFFSNVLEIILFIVF